MSSPAPAQVSLLQMLENDVLLSAGPALLTFLTNVQAAQGDVLKQAAAWVQLQGNLVQGAPTLVASIEGQLASTIAAKIQAAIAKAK